MTSTAETGGGRRAHSLLRFACSPFEDRGDGHARVVLTVVELVRHDREERLWPASLCVGAERRKLELVTMHTKNDIIHI